MKIINASTVIRAALTLLVLPTPVLAQTGPGIKQNLSPHDNQHDFDFEVGRWDAHVRNLSHRLSGSNDWEDFHGNVVTTPLMNGKGNISEMNVEGTVSHKHINIIAVRLYNPASRQWSIYGATSTSGAFDPPQVGQFQGTRGEFYATATFESRAILIRFVWTYVSQNRTHFEQAFSANGGKDWEVNWIYDGVRTL